MKNIFTLLLVMSYTTFSSSIIHAAGGVSVGEGNLLSITQNPEIMSKFIQQKEVKYSLLGIIWANKNDKVVDEITVNTKERFIYFIFSDGTEKTLSFEEVIPKK